MITAHNGAHHSSDQDAHFDPKTATRAPGRVQAKMFANAAGLGKEFGRFDPAEARRLAAAVEVYEMEHVS